MIGFEPTVPDDEPIDRWIADLIELGYVRAVVRRPHRIDRTARSPSD